MLSIRKNSAKKLKGKKKKETGARVKTNSHLLQDTFQGSKTGWATETIQLLVNNFYRYLKKKKNLESKMNYGNESSKVNQVFVEDLCAH